MSIKVYFEDDARSLDQGDELLDKYRPIKAAGGLVVNDDGNVLMIFRKGKWDLPKGKWEEGENMEDCAQREVMEETGLKDLRLKKPLLTSYHTYAEKKGFYLKETCWFMFEAPGSQELVPQIEEGIFEIDWVSRKDLPEYTANTYALIREVLDAGGF